MRLPCRPARFALTTLFVPGAMWAVCGLAKPSDNVPEPTSTIDAEQEPLFSPLLLDDALESLPPHRRRTEAEEDRVEALALFSTGRTLEWQARHAEALRSYQRALWYDPGTETLARAVVRLAIQLKRYDEAVRVALKEENAQALTPMQLMELGAHLRKKGDWQGAATMYQRVLAARENAKRAIADVALRIELGWLYHLTEQPDKAADCFALVRQALDNPQDFGMDEAEKNQLVRDPGLTYVLMGNCFLLAGRLDEAVAAFRKSHRLQPNKGPLGYNLARVEAEKGDPAQAMEKLKIYFDEHSSDEGLAPYRLLARLLEDLDKEDELIDRLGKLRADDAENVPLGYFLAETYRKAQRLDKAESLYLLLVEKTPTVTGYSSLVGIYHETDRPEALLDVLGEAAAQGIPPESLGEEVRSLVEDADLVRTLIEIARKRLQDDPDQLGHHLRLAVALLALEAKQFDAAEQFFDLAVQARPENALEVLHIWGLGLLDAEQYGQAARVFQRGVDEKGNADDKPVFYFYLSGALELAGRVEEALAAARKAAELDPKSPRFRSRAAWILYRNERNEEAAKAYAELLEQFDSDFSSAAVRQVARESRLVLSNLAVLADDLPQAEERLQQVLDEFPDDVAALNDLGYIWADQNVRLQRAYRMIRQAVEEDPDNAAYRDSLGWVLYRLGRPEEALVELEKATADGEPDPVILDHLGDVYHATNQLEKATEAWQRAVRAFEEKEEAEKAKTVQQKITEGSKE